MIVRTWRATAAADRRRLYPQHFTAAVLPKLRGVPGFLGASLLERDIEDEVEFVVQTLLGICRSRVPVCRGAS